MLVHHIMAATFNSQSITAASWFLPFILGIFTGMYLKKFF